MSTEAKQEQKYLLKNESELKWKIQSKNCSEFWRCL